MQANRYHHLAWHHGIELFEAAFSTQTFSRHAHEGFAIGAIAEGAGGYVCRGESMVLPAGTLSLMNPEEPHTGHAAAECVRYTMLYVSETAVREVLGLRVLRGFTAIAPRDRQLELTQALGALAARLNGGPMPDRRLAVEEAVHEVLARAFTHYGGAELRAAGREPAAVRRLRERIAFGVEVGESLSLADLAAEMSLSPSYLVRSVARATGLTPHAHVLRQRVDLARRLLLDGVAAAEAAVAAGFCDQGHMIRQFRRHYGVTPGALLRH
ncbi:AraC family transcriptional regulator [Stappia sp. P2PMeth1]|uniref:AraC family transcriptional regulator n=1 Tax=Stappia sp. P2PMeth1 TaxID=2003586 RepID=UPI0016495CBA|nr:AraC family transcriptional regulator [Stappia sp. P2PMeth1]